MNRAVVLLARAPSARGKTRLTAHLSADRARALRGRLLLDTLSAARAAGSPIIVSYTPAGAHDEMRALAGEATLVVQRGDDLGVRMRNAMQDARVAGADAVVLIGSDLPTLPPGNIVRAFELLAGAHAGAPRCDVVLGPSEDGGFYLVGARGDIPDIFSGVLWSRADVLAQVTGAARQANLAVGLASEWWDVDRPEDLRRCPTYERFVRDGG